MKLTAPLKEWKNTERIVIGGSFRASRIGELVTGRTTAILKSQNIDVELIPIRNHPDEAGLLGAVHLAPIWMFKSFDALLAVDIGETNMRAGVVQLNLKRSNTLAKAKVWKYSLWRHGDEDNVKREHAITQLGSMLKGLIGAAGTHVVVSEVILKSRRAFEAVLGGVHDQPPFLVLHRRVNRLKRHGNILFACAKKPPKRQR